MRHSGARAITLTALFLALTQSTLGEPASEPSKLLSVEAQLLKDAAGGRGTLRLLAKLQEGWHVNSHKPSEDYLIATAVRMEPAKGVRYGKVKYPEGKLKKFGFSDSPLSVYEEAFEIEIPVAWSGPDPSLLTGSLEYQACNDTRCLAPATVAFQARSSVSPPRGLAGGAVPLAEAPLRTSETQARSTAAAGASQDLGNLLERKGLPVVLFGLFLGGLALNLTPCVYPTIPLTVSFFGGQAQGYGHRPLRLASLYVLGMAMTYSALGMAAALTGQLFGAALQSPWVLSGLALVLVLLSLSMFGFYDLRMPAFLMNRAGARTGSTGAFAMGLLVGIVAAPCVGPFVLGLLAFVAARQDVALGFLFFFVLSLGMGLPNLFLATFSANLSRLPRAGQWMEAVKKVFGWVLLAMAAYFVRNLLPHPFGPWLLPAVLLTAAAALTIRGGGLTRPARAAVVAIFLAAAVVLLPRRLPGSEAPKWQPYGAAAVANAGRPAIIDFWAAWCLPCIELDEKTFSDVRVRRELENRALFKADLTRTASAEAVALAKRFSILGVPTVIFLDSSGAERTELRLVGFENAEAFLARISRAP